MTALPACNCDHDFYDGTGINFHFDDYCPKGDAIRSMQQFMRGLEILTGTFWLTHLCVVEGRMWIWQRYRGWEP